MAVREAGPVGSLQEVKEAGLDREDILAIYRNMLITRGIEERGHLPQSLTRAADLDAEELGGADL